jgi:hypothetical protein
LFFGAFLPPENQNTQPVYERLPLTDTAVFSGCKHTALFPFRNGFLCLFFVFLRLFFLLRGFQYVTTKVFFGHGDLGRWMMGLGMGFVGDWAWGMDRAYPYLGTGSGLVALFWPILYIMVLPKMENRLLYIQYLAGGALGMAVESPQRGTSEDLKRTARPDRERPNIYLLKIIPIYIELI